MLNWSCSIKKNNEINSAIDNGWVTLDIQKHVGELKKRNSATGKEIHRETVMKIIQCYIDSVCYERTSLYLVSDSLCRRSTEDVVKQLIVVSLQSSQC